MAEGEAHPIKILHPPARHSSTRSPSRRKRHRHPDWRYLLTFALIGLMFGVHPGRARPVVVSMAFAWIGRTGPGYPPGGHAGGCSRPCLIHNVRGRTFECVSALAVDLQGNVLFVAAAVGARAALGSGERCGEARRAQGRDVRIHTGSASFRLFIAVGSACTTRRDSAIGAAFALGEA